MVSTQEKEWKEKVDEEEQIECYRTKWVNRHLHLAGIRLKMFCGWEPG